MLGLPRFLLRSVSYKCGAYCLTQIKAPLKPSICTVKFKSNSSFHSQSQHFAVTPTLYSHSTTFFQVKKTIRSYTKPAETEKDPNVRQIGYEQLLTLMDDPAEVDRFYEANKTVFLRMAPEGASDQEAKEFMKKFIITMANSRKVIHDVKQKQEAEKLGAAAAATPASTTPPPSTTQTPLSSPSTQSYSLKAKEMEQFASKLRSALEAKKQMTTSASDPSSNLNIGPQGLDPHVAETLKKDMPKFNEAQMKELMEKTYLHIFEIFQQEIPQNPVTEEQIEERNRILDRKVKIMPTVNVDAELDPEYVERAVDNGWVSCILDVLPFCITTNKPNATSMLLTSLRIASVSEKAVQQILDRPRFLKQLIGLLNFPSLQARTEASAFIALLTVMKDAVKALLNEGILEELTKLLSTSLKASEADFYHNCIAILVRIITFSDGTVTTTIRDAKYVVPLCCNLIALEKGTHASNSIVTLLGILAAYPELRPQMIQENIIPTLTAILSLYVTNSGKPLHAERRFRKLSNAAGNSTTEEINASITTPQSQSSIIASNEELEDADESNPIYSPSDPADIINLIRLMSMEPSARPELISSGVLKSLVAIVNSTNNTNFSFGQKTIAVNALTQLTASIDLIPAIAETDVAVKLTKDVYEYGTGESEITYQNHAFGLLGRLSGDSKVQKTLMNKYWLSNILTRTPHLIPVTQETIAFIFLQLFKGPFSEQMRNMCEENDLVIDHIKHLILKAPQNSLWYRVHAYM